MRDDPSPTPNGDGIRGTEEDEVEGSGLHTPNGILLWEFAFILLLCIFFILYCTELYYIVLR